MASKFPATVPVFRDGVTGYCDWYLGVEVKHGELVADRFAYTSDGKTHWTPNPDLHTFLGGRFVGEPEGIGYLTPLTAAACAMYDIGKGSAK